MAQDVSVLELLDSTRQVQEEDVTILLEDLKHRKDLLVDKKVQAGAKKYFTKDAWITALDTLKMLDVTQMQKKPFKAGSSSGLVKGTKRKLVEVVDSTSELPGPSSMKISRRRKGKTNKDTDPEHSSNSSEDDSSVGSEDDGSEIESLKSASRKVKRHSWLPEEDKAIQSYFKEDINDFENEGNAGPLHVAKKIKKFLTKNPNILRDYPTGEKTKKIRIKVFNLRRQRRLKYKKGVEKLSV
ncbi:uncharacterized protein LOC133192077 [Saccostrea echinata]|uniref:uncharacterized protein LOC133192077 n=1 Tax=Saccostrea echinata TaxID=191078 RepID=UPI002A7FA917|nr:uncharacterized protein LOC133192077 [Saccostrea echinata]